MIRTTLLDYGVGNLHSLAKAVAGPGVEVVVEADPMAAIATDRLVLPGVGAFTPAAERLGPAREAVRQALLAGLPCLGICLGMQLLLEASEEGPGLGLGVIAGRVRRLRTARLPQIGWNRIEDASDAAFERAPLALAYYANSYVADPTDPTSVVAWSTHESDRFPAAVRRGNTLGVQFHPEKSSAAGLAFLRSWVATGEPR
ncbi:MAG: imidazole glycerol phosphate synthase subunit HisH [Gemmatimonadales bacterium]|nr:imidazole glycerol phosphate synthase subunit HisH [Gemmatimonadales bacterium]